MIEPLSEQLAELSVRARRAEDNLAAAHKDAREKMAARRAAARDSAATAVAKVSSDIEGAGDKASDDWNALRAKVAADMNKLKASSERRRGERGVGRANDRAARLEWEASVAIDYAIASIEQANVAVLDAVDARIRAKALAAA